MASHARSYRDGPWRYNGVMGNLRFSDMTKYVGFDAHHAIRLQAVADRIKPRLPEVVDRFYDALSADPVTRGIINESPERATRLRETLHQWLIELFEGPYDQAYLDRRARIGRTHVRVGLPQFYMFTSMNVVRSSLTRLIRELAGADANPTLDALNTLLDLELAIMLETYREDLMAKVRQAERERMEARLDEARHLASIGQLAATLAHEIKNPLAGISGAIQVILHTTAADDPHREVLLEILTQIDRLDMAVKDTLIYSRPKAPERRVHRIGEVIDRVLYFLREEPAFRRIRFQATGLQSEITALIDDAQFQQVVSNLLLNAAHASADGGVVKLEVSESNQHVYVEVTDFGHGMPPEVRAQAFEPFYTTKAKGTGLGLPICKHIVEAHGGTIRITSEQGRGTTLRVELPKEADGDVRAPRSAAPAGETP